MFVTEILTEARASLANNPHRISDWSLRRALENFEGRAQAMAEVAAALRRAAGDLDGIAIDPALNRLTGHLYGDQPYSKAQTLMVVRNYHRGIADVAAATKALEEAKAAHVAALRHWSEAA